MLRSQPKRLHIVWFHLCKIFRIGRSVKTTWISGCLWPRQGGVGRGRRAGVPTMHRAFFLECWKSSKICGDDGCLNLCVKKKNLCFSTSYVGKNAVLPYSVLSCECPFLLKQNSSDTSNHQMRGIFFPHTKEFYDTSWVSYNLTQFWPCLRGENIKCHKLSAQVHETVLRSPQRTSDPIAFNLLAID